MILNWQIGHIAHFYSIYLHNIMLVIKSELVCLDLRQSVGGWVGHPYRLGGL